MMYEFYMPVPMKKALGDLAIKNKVPMADMLRGILTDALCEEGYNLEKKSARPTRHEVIEQVFKLKEQGLSGLKIAATTGLHQNTVYAVLKGHKSNVRLKRPEASPQSGEGQCAEGTPAT